MSERKATEQASEEPEIPRKSYSKLFGSNLQISTRSGDEGSAEEEKVQEVDGYHEEPKASWENVGEGGRWDQAEDGGQQGYLNEGVQEVRRSRRSQSERVDHEEQLVQSSQRDHIDFSEEMDPNFSPSPTKLTISSGFHPTDSNLLTSAFSAPPPPNTFSSPPSSPEPKLSQELHEDPASPASTPFNFIEQIDRQSASRQVEFSEKRFSKHPTFGLTDPEPEPEDSFRNPPAENRLPQPSKQTSRTSPAKPPQESRQHLRFKDHNRSIEHNRSLEHSRSKDHNRSIEHNRSKGSKDPKGQIGSREAKWGQSGHKEPKLPDIHFGRPWVPPGVLGAKVPPRILPRPKSQKPADKESGFVFEIDPSDERAMREAKFRASKRLDLERVELRNEGSGAKNRAKTPGPRPKSRKYRLEVTDELLRNQEKFRASRRIEAHEVWISEADKSQTRTAPEFGMKRKMFADNFRGQMKKDLDYLLF